MSRKVKTAHTLAVTGAALALGTLVPVALYQTGMLRSLPDPPGAIFDSEWITSSKDAHPLGIPDALLGLGSYGATLALLLAGGRRLDGRLQRSEAGGQVSPCVLVVHRHGNRHGDYGERRAQLPEAASLVSRYTFAAVSNTNIPLHAQHAGGCLSSGAS
jgi:hypothetical protein